MISETAARRRAEGCDIIALSTGEPDFPTPDHVIAAAHAAALAGQTRYPPTAGLPQLRAAIADRAGDGMEPANVIVSTGAKQVIFNAFLASLDPGDEVILAAPSWSSYRDMVTIADASPVELPCPMITGFKLTPQQLEKAITPRTRWLLLNSPSNPSGAVYTAEEFHALAEVLRRYPQIRIVSDEIYEHLSFETFASFRDAAPDLAERTLTVNGVSKAYSMTGWRIGWGIGSTDLIGAMLAVQGQSTSGACSIAQAAALAALTGGQDLLAHRAVILRERRDRTVGRLDALNGIVCPAPQGAFYVFPSCAGVLSRRNSDGEPIGDDAAFCRHLLDNAGVAIVPGRPFGMPGHFRLSFACSDVELDEGLSRIEKAVAGLN